MFLLGRFESGVCWVQVVWWCELSDLKLVIMYTTNVDGQRFSINYNLEGIYPKRIIKATMRRRLLKTSKQKRKEKDGKILNQVPHAPGRNKTDLASS